MAFPSNTNPISFADINTENGDTAGTQVDLAQAGFDYDSNTIGTEYEICELYSNGCVGAPPPPPSSTQFNASASNVSALAACSDIPILTYFHDGVSTYPEGLDNVYLDFEQTMFLASGYYLNGDGQTGFRITGTIGVVMTGFDCF